MKCRKYYADMEKYRKYRNGYNSRYYQKTEDARNRGQKWSEDEVAMLFDQECTDTELSEYIGRSVRAIQIKRSKVNAALRRFASVLRSK